MYTEKLVEQLSSNQSPWMAGFRKESFAKFDVLPIPKWKRVQFQDYQIPAFYFYSKSFYSNPEDSLQIGSMMELMEEAGAADYLRPPVSYGMDEKFVTLAEAFFNSGLYVHTKKNQQVAEPVRVFYELDQENPVVMDHHIIVAEPNSKVTVVIDYRTADEFTAFHNGILKVYAKEYAEVTIVKIQRMNDSSYHFDSNIAFVAQGAKVNWISIELGSELGVGTFTTILEKEGSEGDLKSIYIGDKARKLDLGYSMIHQGMRTVSNIETRGVLKDRAKKVFRGNLDFKRGAKRSKGVEEEYVILLDPGVKSDAIPALLCEEDDVEGAHAASAGQIDEDQLFYLMSRGLSEIDSKKLIVEASFRPILDRVPLEDVVRTVEEEIHRRLQNG